MREAALLLLGVAALALALLLGGAEPFGRILLAAGLPGPAATFLDDPAWRGVALHESGDAEAAARAFRQAGDPYNAGVAEARAGNYAAALEEWDLARAAGDARSGANFDLLVTYYAGVGLDPGAPVSWHDPNREGPTTAAPVGRGEGRASATGTESTNEGSAMDLPELRSRGPLNVRRVFDDRFVAASDRWLATLPDVPGAYLAQRIAFEHKRRAKAGLSPPEPEDPQ